MIASLFEFDGRYEEDKGQQFLSGRGLYNDGFTRIRRLEGHGTYSNPPPGSQGLLLALNGNMDEAYLLGVDHPQKRPSGLPVGSKAIYDANGNIFKLVMDGAILDLQSRTFTATSGAWNITTSGPVTITAAEVVVNGNLTVNGNVVSTGTITDSDGNNGA
jgi:phage baseplate assembly protein V